MIKGLLLAQLENEGYSIFVVTGPLPETEADAYAQSSPIPSQSDLPTGPSKKALASSTFTGIGNRLGASSSSGVPSAEDVELAKALAMSLGQDISVEGVGLTGGNGGWGVRGDEDDETLKRALKASMDEGGVDDKSLQAALQASREEDERKFLEEAIRESLRSGGKFQYAVWSGDTFRDPLT